MPCLVLCLSLDCHCSYIGALFAKANTGLIFFWYSEVEYLVPTKALCSCHCLFCDLIAFCIFKFEPFWNSFLAPVKCVIWQRESPFTLPDTLYVWNTRKQGKSLRVGRPNYFVWVLFKYYCWLVVIVWLKRFLSENVWNVVWNGSDLFSATGLFLFGLAAVARELCEQSAPRRRRSGRSEWREEKAINEQTEFLIIIQQILNLNKKIFARLWSSRLCRKTVSRTVQAINKTLFVVKCANFPPFSANRSHMRNCLWNCWCQRPIVSNLPDMSSSLWTHDIWQTKLPAAYNLRKKQFSNSDLRSFLWNYVFQHSVGVLRGGLFMMVCSYSQTNHKSHDFVCRWLNGACVT